MACAGDVPTLRPWRRSICCAQHLPDLKVRVVNVVDLMTLQSRSQHPHGLEDSHFDALFTRDKPVIFAYHGYPALIYRLTYKRTNHDNFHVHGFEEEGTTTTPFDMVVRNHLTGSIWWTACWIMYRAPMRSISGRKCATGSWIMKPISASAAPTCLWSATGYGPAQHDERRMTDAILENRTFDYRSGEVMNSNKDRP